MGGLEVLMGGLQVLMGGYKEAMRVCRGQWGYMWGEMDHMGSITDNEGYNRPIRGI